MNIYVVGGAVRDVLMGKQPKDIDYVVEGSCHEEMIFNGFRQVGADFPVYLDEDGNEYALARTERKTGTGYHGFDVNVDNVTLMEDLQRRDLTINSIAVPLDKWNEFKKAKHEDKRQFIIDPFNGLEDIEKCLLRATSPISFIEDPVRVLRIFRFSARYNFYIDTETKQKILECIRNGEMNNLTVERIWLEIEKTLTQGKYPSSFFIKLQMYELSHLFDQAAMEQVSIESLNCLDKGFAKHLDVDLLLALLFSCTNISPTHFDENVLLNNKIKQTIRHSKYVINAIVKKRTSPVELNYLFKLLNAYHQPDNLFRLQPIFEIIDCYDNISMITEFFQIVDAFNKAKDINFQSLTEEEKQELTGNEIAQRIDYNRMQAIMM